MDSPLFQYLLHLGDNALILGHRDSEWCGHGPVLEQDIALTNIALDLIGQARLLFQYAADIANAGGGTLVPPVTEDSLAYLRDAQAYRNCLLVEQPNGDWAFTTLRQFFFSAYQYGLYKSLRESPDERLAAIAAKALKEVRYHLEWSGEWIVRLGDGTPESSSRIQAALDELWMYTGELFRPSIYESELAGIGLCPSPENLEADWMQSVREVFQEATLDVPAQPGFQSGGKKGIHSEHLGYILAEMQFLQRAYPGCEW